MEISVKQGPTKAERLEAERGVKPEVVPTRAELLKRLEPEPGFKAIENRITAQHRTTELHEGDQKALVYSFSAFYRVPADPAARWITVNMERSAPLLMDSDTFELIKNQEYTVINSTKSGIMRIDILIEPTKAQNFLKRGAPRCQYCDTQPGELRCATCKIARYCGAECQRKHWIERHAFACKRLADITLAPPPKHAGITPEQAAKLGVVPKHKLSKDLQAKVEEMDL